MPKKYNKAKPKSRSRELKRVALLVESDMALDRGIARGVGEYIRNNTGWVVMMDPMTEISMKTLEHWEPDGIITSIHLPAIYEVAKIENIPIVGFGSYSEKVNKRIDFPVVTSDQYKIGTMAAHHFINCGMPNFAFCGGYEEADWCIQRRDGFSEELAKYGHSCHIYKPDFKLPVDMPDSIRSLGKWLDSLPKPTGVFVFFDGWARWVLDACILRNIQVPQEVSVLGVDNDRWLCELAQPMLSSIDANLRNAGYTAAEMLNCMMSDPNLPPPPALTYIEPVSVVARDSSNYFAFEDPEVATAIRYIKEHACDPISTADVLKVTGMSNSTAYRKFMKAIGRSIHNEIQRRQINRVKELLTTTNLNVSSIAQSSGFENVRYLTQVFRDITGKTPTEYRRTQSTPLLA